MWKNKLIYVVCALVLLGLAAVLPASGAPTPGGIDVEKYISVDGGTTWLDADTAPGPALLNGTSPRFRFNVTNLGGSPLQEVSLTDSAFGAIAVPASLAAGETATVTRTGAWAEGQHSNTATASGKKGSETVTDTDTGNYFGATATIDIEKYVSVDGGVTWVDADAVTGPTLLQSGDAPQFKFVVTNTGNVALSGLAFSDTVFGSITAPGTLASGATAQATLTGSWAAGQHTNAATASGSFTDDGGHTASPSDTDAANYFGAEPVIDIEKSISVDNGVSWDDADAAPGPTLASGISPQFKFTVTNTGNVALSNVVLADSVFGPQIVPGTLAVGGSAEVVIPGTWQMGQHTNMANASGDFTDDAGNTGSVSDSDPGNYFGAGTPAISIEKLTNGEEADTAPGPSIDVGDPVQWTYVVTNTGDVPLTGVVVTDDQGVTVSAPKTALAPGESMTATGSGTAVEGQYANVGTVTGMPPVGPNVTASDPSHYLGVVVNLPAAAFTGTPTSGPAPLLVQFTDQSVGDGITKWLWTFGDGASSNERNASHTYTVPGMYTVSLNVTNATGSDEAVGIDYITVTEPVVPPTANFHSNVTSGFAPLAVQFTDDSTGEGITNWTWEFGDGGTSHEQDPVHIYAAPGVYTVNLTVVNAGGSDFERKLEYITVTEVTAPPVAAFSGTPITGKAPLAVTFTDLSTGVPTAWAWDFGDGGVSSLRNPTHTYTAAGNYSVNLTVTNAEGTDFELMPDYITVTEPVEETDPYNGPHVPATVIQAEDFDAGGEGVAYHDLEPANLGNSNYRPGEGVDIENEAGVRNVGWIRSGEYLRYSFDTTIAGSFTLTLRAANPDATPKPVAVYLDGAKVGEVQVGGTGAFTAYREFAATAPMQVSTGRHVLTLAFEDTQRLNLDWLRIAAGTIPITPQLSTVPFGPGNVIPGRVEAENFDRPGADAAYYDTSAANEGGAYRPNEPVDIEYTASEASYNVGWIRAGEYLVYSVEIANAGDYSMTFRAANPDASGKPIDVFVDGTKVGTAWIGSTRSFGTFKPFTIPVTLPAGGHQIRLAFPSGRLNLNYFEFTQGTAPAEATPASFSAAPTTATYGSAVKFTLNPAEGKTVKAVLWSFDAPAHLQTWNSRDINPTFFYPQPGTFSPLVRIAYTDNTVDEVHIVDYIRAT